MTHIRDDDDPLGIGHICRSDQEDWPCPFIQGYDAALADAKAAVEALRGRWVAEGDGFHGVDSVDRAAVLAAIDELAR